MIAIEITNKGKDVKPLPKKYESSGYSGYTTAGGTWGVVSLKDYEAATELAKNNNIVVGRRFWKPYTNCQGGSRGIVKGILDFTDPAVRFTLGKEPKNVVCIQAEIAYATGGGYITKYSVEELASVEWQED